MNQEEKQVLEEIINDLLNKREIDLPKIKFTDKENKIKFKIISVICRIKGKLSLTNNDNKPPEIKKMLEYFLMILKDLTLPVLFNVYPKEYYTLIKYELFENYIKTSKKELYPFFFMVSFFSYINTGKSRIEEVKHIQSDKFFLEIKSNYEISKILMLPKIIEIYNKLILEEDDQEKSNENEEEDYRCLKEYFEIYSVYNYIYSEGYLVSLVDSIFKAITPEIDNILLKEGPEYIYVNILIKFMIKTISEFFDKDEEYNKDIKINDLCDILVGSIKTFIENTTENNYPKFILEYSKTHKLNENENLNIISNFFLMIGHWTKNENENQSENDEYETEYVFNNNKDKDEDKNEDEKKDIIKSEKKKSYLGNEVSNERIIIKMISIDEYTQENEKFINNNKDYEKLNNNNNSINNNNLENKINCFQKAEQKENQNDAYNNFENNDEMSTLKEKIRKLESKCEGLEEELKESKAGLEKKISLLKKKVITSNLKKEKEINKIKQSMKRIEYRDISKNIINNYLLKFEKSLDKKSNKKDNVFKICSLLKGDEKKFFSELVNKYYESNDLSHMTQIFKELEEKAIVDEKDDIINNIINDYICNIFNNNKNVSVSNDEKKFIEEKFKIYNIIFNLYKKYNYYKRK